MNAHERLLSDRPGELAKVHYGDGELTLVRPGRYVLCAVSGRPIPLEVLRYWNPKLQEAYAGPAEALARWQSLQTGGAARKPRS